MNTAQVKQGTLKVGDVAGLPPPPRINVEQNNGVKRGDYFYCHFTSVGDHDFNIEQKGEKGTGRCSETMFVLLPLKSLCVRSDHFFCRMTVLPIRACEFLNE